MKKLFKNKIAILASTVVFSIFVVLFFGSVTINSINTGKEMGEKVIFLGRMSDNLYLQSDQSVEGDVFVKVRYIDGTESGGFADDFMKWQYSKDKGPGEIFCRYVHWVGLWSLGKRSGWDRSTTG